MPMKATVYHLPHQLLIYPPASQAPPEKMIVIWKNGRLHEAETGKPIALQPGTDAVIRQLKD